MEESDLISKKIQEMGLPEKAKNLGSYLINGGPGRGLGTKNKHTLIIEQMAETFLDAKGKEAFQKTLIKNDGTLDLDALELLLKYNPALSKAFGEALGSTVNIIINNNAATKEPIDIEVSDG